MMRRTTHISSDIPAAASCLKRGGLVAFPTETVFGLGADAFNAKALASIFEAKGRPSDNPLIAHIASPEWIGTLARTVPAYAQDLVDAFFPGPLTLVLPRQPDVLDQLTAGLDTVGVRMPDHPVALELIGSLGSPVAAPSANSSGRPSTTRWEDVQADLDGKVDIILRSAATRLGIESTVLDCTGSSPVILRPGSVTLEDLQLVCPDVGIAESAAEALGRSPGTRYRHYQPNASVYLVSDRSEITQPEQSAFIGVSKPTGCLLEYLAEDEADYAKHVFSFFRDAERAGITTIHCMRPSVKGIGKALLDRLERASW